MAARIGIVLFRHDLRLADQPALHEACSQCGAVIPVYVWDAEEQGEWSPGGAKKYWLHHSLVDLLKSLNKRKSALIVRQGDTLEVVRNMCEETGASAVYWNRRYEPASIAADARLKIALADDGIEAKSFKGSLIAEPWEVETKSGGHYKVFTPFWKTCQKSVNIGDPLPPPKKIPAPDAWPASDAIDDLGLEPTIDWAGGIREAWDFGEAAAHKVLDAFLGQLCERYNEDRDYLALSATSRMSPYLHTGQISPRQVWVAVQQAIANGHCSEDRANEYLRQIFWREFGYHLIYHEPQTVDTPLRTEFELFPWSDDKEALKRWQRGRTGYPIVDAGMRELWATGYMHNRARMVVASFLVKDLGIHWLEGARWFWDTLVDADLANNTLGWQWAAGCGADAAPYFRIFNPVRQGERFDAKGEYVRRWIPDIGELPDKYIHKPWEAPADVLSEAGIELGETYPEPIVDHHEARDRAMERYEAIKK